MKSKLRVVITGASSGLGAAIADSMIDAGHDVFVTARREDRLAALCDGHANARFLASDVGDAASVDRFIDWLRGETDTVDTLIHCAGHYGPIGNVSEVDRHEWWQALQDNLFGTFLMAQAVVPLMQSSADARILLFSGGGAFNPMPRYSAYAVSKAGVVRLAETMAQELSAQGITVNCVAPGFVATEIHEATLAAGPEKSGQDFYEMTKAKMQEGGVPLSVPIGLVNYLLSDAAKGLTGKTISAGFDPWGTPTFDTAIDALNESDLYTMQRINLVHLPESDFTQSLAKASKR